MKPVSLLRCLLLAVFCGGMSSCTTQNLFQKSHIPKDAQIFLPDSSYQYVIHKGDKISVSIWDHEDMSVGSVFSIYNSNDVTGKWAMVDAAGNLAMPKLGEVQVAGKTVMEAEATLRDQYKKWIVNPIIHLKVLNKEITVLGELHMPGKYALDKDNNTLLDAIGKAGDFDLYADRGKVLVVRSTSSGPKMITVDLRITDAMFSQNVQIQPGDIVYVPSRHGKIWDKRGGATLIPIGAAITSIVLLSTLTK